MKKQTQPKAKAPDGTPAAAQPPKTKAAQAKSAAETVAPAVGTAPAVKGPRLSDCLKAKADRLIAARDKKKVPAEAKAPARADRKPREPEEDLVVFAFRLSADERELIHKAAGPAKASRFVRALAVAAACHDEGAIKLLLQSAKASA